MSLTRSNLTRRKACRHVRGIKPACSPINTGASSYEFSSDDNAVGQYNSNRLSAIEQAGGAGHDGDNDDAVQTSSRALNIEGSSNKLLGFSQTLSRVRGTQTQAITTGQVNYTLDANGNLTSDGFRAFEYDQANRLSRVKLPNGGDFESTQFLHDAKGQRVFKSEARDHDYEPKASALGSSYLSWLRLNFSALFDREQSKAMLGTAYVYGDADAQLPDWALLGEYGNGSAKGKGRSEYIWLPTDDQGAIPVGLYRNEQFYAIHTDHLGTPRLITDKQNQPVWQWAYSAFGNNPPTGVLQARGDSNYPGASVKTSKPAIEFDLRFPGQIADAETGQFYNYFRTYQQEQGRYTQGDPIGLSGGLSRFGYVGGNALGFSDPQGLQVAQVAIGIGTGLGVLGIVEMSRPKNMSSTQESLFDRYCKTSDDPCAALKTRLRQEIELARSKMNKMRDDDPVTGLHRNAYSTANRAVTGTGTTWLGHVEDLNGRLGKIQELISLAHKIGCDVTAEMIEAASLLTPRRPGR